MTNTDTLSKHRVHAKKRQWREGGAVRSSATPRGGALDAATSALLTKYRSFSSSAHRPPSMVDVLPPEAVAQVLGFLDGHSLLQCSATCRVMAGLSHSRDVWKNICMKTWPSLKTQVLPQLPGAPDYDLIRLYGGSWRRCFVEHHRLNQRVDVRVEIPHFSSSSSTPSSSPSATSSSTHSTTSSTLADKVVSDTFSIGEHRFCLWIFPRGNPNEPLYAGRALSVYLVLTDLDRRPPDWLTCAVFSLSVLHREDPKKNIEWHSCLADNKFDVSLNNWGVHSLGTLPSLRDPSNGLLRPEGDAITVAASVRLMTITFRVVLLRHLADHRGLGLVEFTSADTLQLPFCCSLAELLAKLEQSLGIDKARARVWCFNQPIVSGQALRPRKQLTQKKGDAMATPLFGHALCDGVDIDAYSFCQLYVEDPDADDPVLNLLENASSSSSSGDVDMEEEKESADEGYLFVKLMDPTTLELVFLGRYALPSSPTATVSALLECVAARLGCASYELALFKEEIAPTLFSGPIHWPQHSSSSFSSSFVSLQTADIVIFTYVSTAASGAFHRRMHAMLLAQYASAERMLRSPSVYPTLEHIETLAERLDIPKFRVRSAFRKCHEDGRLTLRYIMEGRHLGFICDSCGETDFKGPRFNCSVCSDYDLCRHCHEKCHDVSHRYANVDGKWQRVYDFKDHSVDHAMREMLPVFYEYERPTGAAARAW